MTIDISNNTPRISYSVAAGVTQTSFAVPFEFFADTDLNVYVDEVLQTITTNYTVSGGDGSTGTVTMTVTGEKTVLISRDTTIERTTDFTAGVDINRAALNTQLDTLTAIGADVKDLAERAIRIKDFDPSTASLELPAASVRADKLLSFDTEGGVSVQSAADLLTGSVLGANYTKASHTGDGTTVAFSTTEAAGSKNNIQVYIDGVYQNKDTFSISGSTLTFTEAPPLNSAIEFIVGNAVTSLTTDPAVVTYNQGGTGAQDRTLTSKLQDTVSVKDFGAVGDGVADDINAIKNAIIHAVASNNFQVFFPAGTYLISSGIPLVKKVKLFGLNPDTTIIQCNGSTSAIYTAILSGSTFTDNLDASLGDITSKAKSAQRCSIENLGIQHIGSVSGQSPSGIDWDETVQLVGCYDGYFSNLSVSNQTNNIGDFHVKFAWRTKMYNISTSRGGSYTGGSGIKVGSQTNSAIMQGCSTYGAYSIGIDISSVEGFTVIEPNPELASTAGLRFSGNSVRVIGGYYEGNGIDIQIGNGSSPANSFLVDHPWVNGAAGATNGIWLDAAVRGQLNSPYFTGSYSASKFKTTSSATYNYNSKIIIHSGNAATYDLSANGLIGGRHRLEVRGDDYSAEDYRGFAEYSTNSGNRISIYREGSFTPTLTAGTSGTITLDSSQDLLQWTLMDRVVTIKGRITVSSVSSPTGTLNLGNLPFSVATEDERSEYSALQVETGFTSVYRFFGSAQLAGASEMRIYAKDGSGNFVTTPADQIVAGDLWISGSYLTDD